MRHFARSEWPRPVIVGLVTLLGIALILCLVHGDDHDSDPDMLYGACSVALATALCTAGVELMSPGWWLISGATVRAYAAFFHLPDPPPKSSPLL